MRPSAYCVSLTQLLTALAAVVLGSPTSVAASQHIRVFCLDADLLAKTKTRIQAGDPALKPAMDKLLADAEKALRTKPPSVMDKPRTPPSGDKHDYMSFGPYWWPDPDKPDGLPYIRRDGQVNPDSRKSSDHVSLARMVGAVDTLSLAYFLTDKEPYAQHAARILRVWFLDPATKMNPNLTFAQGIPGRCHGRSTGIIETACLGSIVDAVGLLEPSKAWTDADQKGMLAWFNAYLEWLRTSENGKAVATAHNNIGTWANVQLAAFALFIGDRESAKRVVETGKDRIARQIEPDGRQPRELKRTKSFSYSIFNLDALFTLARLARHVGVDLWRYETPDHRTLRKALDFLAPYADHEKQWPHKQISSTGPMALLPLLRRGVIAYQDDRYEALIRKLPDQARVTSARTQLLWPRP